MRTSPSLKRNSNISSNEPREIKRELDSLYSFLHQKQEDDARLRELLEAKALSVSRSTSQSIPTSTFTLVEFDQSDFGEERGLWDSANPTQLVIDNPGRYLIGAEVSWTGTAAGDRFLGLRHNGSLVKQVQGPAGAAVLSQQILAVLGLQLGDTIEVEVWQNSGGNLPLLVGTGQLPTLWAERIGSLALLSKTGGI